MSNTSQRRSRSRRFGRPKTQGRISEINVTPLIDLAFALLIIFMIAAPMMEQSIRIDLPEQSSDSPPPPMIWKFVRYRSTRRAPTTGTRKNGLPISSVRIRGIASEPEPPALSIRADATINTKKVIDVIDYVKEQKLTKISLRTRQE